MIQITRCIWIGSSDLDTLSVMIQRSQNNPVSQLGWGWDLGMGVCDKNYETWYMNSQIDQVYMNFPEKSLHEIKVHNFSALLIFNKFKILTSVWVQMSFVFKCLHFCHMEGQVTMYTLLKSDVTRRDHVVRCHGSHECWFIHCQFHSQFHSRRHSLRITLKYTTLVCMRSSNTWTTKPWQRS